MVRTWPNLSIHMEEERSVAMGASVHCCIFPSLVGLVELELARSDSETFEVHPPHHSPTPFLHMHVLEDCRTQGILHQDDPWPDSGVHINQVKGQYVQEVPIDDETIVLTSSVSLKSLLLPPTLELATRFTSKTRWEEQNLTCEGRMPMLSALKSNFNESMPLTPPIRICAAPGISFRPIACFIARATSMPITPFLWTQSKWLKSLG